MSAAIRRSRPQNPLARLLAELAVCRHPARAKASADLYSLIEMAKANGLEPYRYLRYLFEKLPFADNTVDYQALLPMRLRPEDIALNHVITGA